MHEDFINLTKKYNIYPSVVTVDFNPTIEGIAKYIYDTIVGLLKLPDGAYVSCVDVFCSSTLVGSFKP